MSAFSYTHILWVCVCVTVDRSEACRRVQCENCPLELLPLPAKPTDVNGKPTDVDRKTESMRATVWFHGALELDNDDMLFRLALLVPEISVASTEAALLPGTTALEEKCHRLVPVTRAGLVEAGLVEARVTETFEGTFRIAVTLYSNTLVTLMRRCGCVVGLGIDDSYLSTRSHDATNNSSFTRMPASVSCPFIGLGCNDDIPRVCQCTASERIWNAPWDYAQPHNQIHLSSIPVHTRYASSNLRRAQDYRDKQQEAYRRGNPP